MASGGWAPGRRILRPHANGLRRPAPAAWLQGLSQGPDRRRSSGEAKIRTDFVFRKSGSGLADRIDQCDFMIGHRPAILGETLDLLDLFILQVTAKYRNATNKWSP